ncbi:MAG: restriction endonuclease [Muribaculaceae bacterium]|nr:restriction endonuclease [Muribaculaceae bacterium]
MNYWLHRIKGGDHAYEYAWPLLFDHNWLSIGWSDFSKEAFLADVREKGCIEAINGWIIDKWGDRPENCRNRWNLYRFLKDMKPGDWVLVPTGGEFSVYEIVDDVILTNETIDRTLIVDWNGNKAVYEEGYLKNENHQYIDMGFYRKVKPIKLHIPRAEYADAVLTSRMKIRLTNANINNLSESIIRAIEHRPIDLKAEVMKDAVPDLLAKIKKLADDAKFEKLVKWYLKAIGANEVTVPSKNESPTEEGDADVVAYFDNIKTAIMVQVKKHSGTTDEWAVSQIKAYEKNHRYGGDYMNQMWVVSTCEKFNEKAERKADEAGVRLINGLEFARMILEAGLQGLSLS